MRYLIGLIFLLSTLTAQVTDKNFKENLGSGFAVVVFTSNYQEKDLDDSILKGVNGYDDAKIITVKSADVKKVVKKLRIRNYPSIALFHSGSKVDVWKADMSGDCDCSASDIKKAIADVNAEDVF